MKKSGKRLKLNQFNQNINQKIFLITNNLIVNKKWKKDENKDNKNSASFKNRSKNKTLKSHRIKSKWSLIKK